MTTNELLGHFRDANYKLTRDLLYFWEKQGWINPQMDQKKSLKRRLYPPSEVTKITILLNCYAQGMTPEAAYRMSKFPDDLRGQVLSRLLKATNELGNGSLFDDRQRFLDLVARNLSEVLNCESSAIFLFPPGPETPMLPSEPEKIVQFRDERARVELVASWGDETGNAGAGRDFWLHEDPHAGLTGWIVRRGGYDKPKHDGESPVWCWPGVSLFGAQLHDHLYRSQRPPSHLPSGRCFSLMMRPLIDRKRRIIGWIKVENRKGPDERPSEVTFFDPADEAILEYFSNLIVRILENIAVVQASDSLLKTVLAAPSFLPASKDDAGPKRPAAVPGSIQAVCSEVVRQALTVLGADRADVCWAFGSDLKVLASDGPTELDIGATPPKKCLTRRVFQNREVLNVASVGAFSDYAPCWTETQSELLAPLLIEKRCLGVLNVESRHSAFFDDRDVELLQYLARHVIPAAEIAASRDSIYSGLIERTQDWQRQAAEEDDDVALKPILESVQLRTNLDFGIVYVADYQLGELRCASSRPRRDNFSHKFNGRSLAAEVFRRKKSLFISDPHNSELVDPKGLDIFGIEGPLIGAPLMFGQTVVGVLVVWGSPNRRQPENSDIALIERYTRLTVTTAAISHAHDRMTCAIRDVQQVLALIQQDAEFRTVIRILLESLLRHGFDRARVFEFDAKGGAFVCVDSAGVETSGEFIGRTIRLDKSHYARMTYDRWKEGNMAPSVRWPKETGPDPSAQKLRKPLDLPWVIAPLSVGELFGYLAVDNAATRKYFNESDLEFIGLFGCLAAQAVASRSWKSGGWGESIRGVQRTRPSNTNGISMDIPGARGN